MVIIFYFQGSVKYTTLITSKGHFEISEGNAVLAEGSIEEGTSSIEDVEWKPAENSLDILDTNDIYQILRIKGYDYGPRFQCLQAYNIKSKYPN